MAQIGLVVWSSKSKQDYWNIGTDLELMTAPPQHEPGRRSATIQGYSPGSASPPPTMVGTSPSLFTPHLAHTGQGYLWDLQMWSRGIY